ncbi:hypothetical protein K456DRAFT_48553 [Colletotrichum gloeosporioides 23]|nr:hypothetical protein K456DRAFT_48553 [Colletotrichum gloeosporioides 23]
MCRFPQLEPASGPTSGTSWGKFSGGVGTCFFDWRVGETSVQSTPESTQLFLVSSCCSPTLNWKEMKRHSGYDDEDINDWMPSDAEVGGLSFSDDYESIFIEKCRFCADPMHKRAGWGLVVHPAEKSGSYVRVGAFVFFST